MSSSFYSYLSPSLYCPFVLIFHFRDHAVSSSNRNQETDSTADSNEADDDNNDNDDPEHVSVRISSFGKSRNRSGTNSSSEGNIQQNFSPKTGTTLSIKNYNKKNVFFSEQPECGSWR